MHIRFESREIWRDTSLVGGRYLSVRIDVDIDGERLYSWVLGHLCKIRVAHSFLVLYACSGASYPTARIEKYDETCFVTKEYKGSF